MIRRILLILFVLGPAASVGAQSPAPNTNILRWAEGSIAYRVKSSGQINGSEHWRLTVHPDGSRTMAARVEYAPRSVQRHVVQRVDAQWRTLDTYALYWIDGEWRGTSFATRTGPNLNVVAATPAGTKTQSLSVSEQVVMVPHVLAVDSWRAMRVDKTKAGPQPVNAYNYNATGDGESFLLGRVMDYRMTYVGPEKVTVPAGTFATEHYRVEDAVDLYLTGDDALVVKFVYESIDREHLLTELKKGP